MQYKTLGELRSTLARRLGFGATGSAGINAGLLDSFLQNAQDQLVVQFDWRGLIKFDEKTTGAGQTLYSYADDCDPMRISDVAIWDGVRWVTMREGISFAQRSTASSRTIPVRYERFAAFEVWPEPDAAYIIRRYYVASPERFTQDNDRASIDDGLILLHAIANAKAHYKQADAASYGTQLQAMMRQIKAKNRGQSVQSRSEPDDVYLARPRDA